MRRKKSCSRQGCRLAHVEGEPGLETMRTHAPRNTPRPPPPSVDPSRSQPRLYENASCVVAGLTADANLLVNHARVSAQRYLYQYGEQEPLEQLVKEVCNYKQVGCAGARKRAVKSGW